MMFRKCLEKVKAFFFTDYDKMLDEVFDVPPLQEAGNPLIGEPVKSFVESLEREPRRYRIRQITMGEASANAKDFQKYTWMSKSSGTEFYKLKDRKTFRVYYAHVENHRIYKVFDLPFELNGYEMHELSKALYNHAQKPRMRLWSIQSLEAQRAREEKAKREEGARIEFAAQFGIDWG